MGAFATIANRAILKIQISEIEKRFILKPQMVLHTSEAFTGEFQFNFFSLFSFSIVSSRYSCSHIFTRTHTLAVYIVICIETNLNSCFLFRLRCWKKSTVKTIIKMFGKKEKRRNNMASSRLIFWFEFLHEKRKLKDKCYLFAIIMFYCWFYHDDWARRMLLVVLTWSDLMCAYRDLMWPMCKIGN